MTLKNNLASPTRLLQLDVLRGVAILLVLGHHPVLAHDQAGDLGVFAQGWYCLGWTGVDLFFVLSGFLIGGLLFNELKEHHDIDARRFLIRRGLKIWPSYYAYIIIIFLLLCLRVPLTLGITPPMGDSIFSAFKGVAANLLHVQNYLPTVRAHTWSLAVEEHFYLILPFLLIFATRLRRREASRLDAIPALPWIAVGLVVACTTGRCLASLDPVHGNFFNIITPTHLRLDGLFLGVLLAYYARFRPDWIEHMGRHRNALFASGLVLIAPMMVLDHDRGPYVMPIGPTLLYLGYGSILCAVVSTPIGEGWLGKILGSLPARLVAFIGVYSYPIYLWHLDLARAPLLWLSKASTAPALPLTIRWVVFTTAYLALATLAGIVMSLAIERPTLALRDRLFPRRSRPLEADELPAFPAKPLSHPARPGPIPLHQP